MLFISYHLRYFHAVYLVPFTVFSCCLFGTIFGIFMLFIWCRLQDLMLFCDACDKGYHMQCHDPAVEEKPQGKRSIAV